VDLSNVPRTVTDIFFDYDQYRIRQDAITVLETNAKVLIGRYPDKKVVIQGHCDERGTREYNLILGERRALAVKNYLIDLGVPEKNMQVISYGKEKPFCIEHSKKCWQKNRRSHFVIN
jgi:peptidoglycan-associated lipoprotein